MHAIPEDVPKRRFPVWYPDEHQGNTRFRSNYLPGDNSRFAIIAQYNHPDGRIQFYRWPRGIDSHDEQFVGVWYGHPALVAIFKYRPYRWIAEKF